MAFYDITLATPGPLCYYADAFEAKPVRVGNFLGSVAEGGSVNHSEVRFTPHGTGTHTECYGHISADPEATLDRCFLGFKYRGCLLSIEPEKRGEDSVVTRALVQAALMGKTAVEALVIRTVPNTEHKRTQDYSGTNPPYLEENLATYLVELGVQHLLVDLPSVDKEVDGGALAFHRQFWQVDGPLPLRKTATITELIYVPSSVKDGLYDVYIAPALWKLDAAPSRIWLESNL